MRGLCLALVFAAGCGGGSSGGGATISSQILSGKIGGAAWSLGTAESDSSLSTSDQYFVTMFPDTFTACGFGAPTTSNELIVNLPRKVGSYNLGLALSVTFSIPPSDNLVTFNGHIVIDAVTATTISGGMNVTRDAGNSVNGQFQATVCP